MRGVSPAGCPRARGTEVAVTREEDDVITWSTRRNASTATAIGRQLAPKERYEDLQARWIVGVMGRFGIKVP